MTKEGTRGRVCDGGNDGADAPRDRRTQTGLSLWLDWGAPAAPGLKGDVGKQLLH